MAQEILVFSESEADTNFVYHMEDVLDVYCQPYDPSLPRICMDEMGKNLVKDKYPPKPGQVAREDYTYEKGGSANLFIAYEPLAGKRYVKVTEHRTKKDWALFMRGGCSKNTIPMPQR